MQGWEIRPNRRMRHRPATARDRQGVHLYLMEDESGIANVIVTPDLYERQRLLVTRCKFLMVEGPLQNQDGVIQSRSLIRTHG